MMAIVCVDQNWGIGCNDKLLFKLKNDLKRFRTITEGKTVIYGRKTLETFPNQKPLPNRINIMISRSYLKNSRDDMLIANSISEAFDYIDNSDNVIVIGGETIYAQFLPYCNRVDVTKVYTSDTHANKFFPNLDKSSDWKNVNESNIIIEAGYTYQYFVYKRIS